MFLQRDIRNQTREAEQHLLWPRCDSHTVIPTEVERAAAKLLVRKHEWGELSEARIGEVQVFLQRRNVNMTFAQARSLRSSLLMERGIAVHGTMYSDGAKLAALFRDGATMDTLARQYDYPPVGMFRSILAARSTHKISAKQIKRMLQDPRQHFTDPRDIAALVYAQANDTVNVVDCSKLAKEAAEFEEATCQYLNSLGVKFQRQEEVAAQQQEQDGIVTATPDILLDRPVFINGQKVSWIDSKNFYGSLCPFVHKKTCQQMAKYVSKWGTGAIVFSLGFASALKIPGTGTLGNFTQCTCCTRALAITVALPLLAPVAPVAPVVEVHVVGKGLLRRKLRIRWPAVDGTSSW
jgi:hypothetical protein